MAATKPEFYSAEHARAFTFEGVVASYWTRPPYTPEAYDFLLSLLVDEPRAVLDLGSGPGKSPAFLLRTSS